MDNLFVLLQQSSQPLTQNIEMSQVGWVDVAYVIFSIWALIVGYRGGISKEFSKFISVLAGLLLTFQYSESAAIWLKRNSILPPEVALPLSYVLILIVSVLVIFYVLQIVGKLVEIKIFHLFEKIGGMLLALARYTLILGLAAHFLMFFSIPFISKSFKTDSVTGQYLIAICPKTYKALSKIIILPKWEQEPQVTIK